jgi:predicted unusual protein kinase regulating ubiquinone biosynthesis (AarF/ABC1/UbiB family)
MQQTGEPKQIGATALQGRSGEILPSNRRWQWQKSGYSLRSRQFQIFRAATKLGLAAGLDLVLPNASIKHQQKRAQQVVDTLIALGPTFIKIGQSLSTRVDILPPIYTQALQQLQDRVPAFDLDTAIAIIEAELGAPLDRIFAAFDPVPLAAASLGQVHRARLRTGQDVVIKIQRPGLQRLFDLDFQAIESWLKSIDRLLPWVRGYDLVAVHREFFGLLYREIDYNNEGQNADRFRANFQQNKLVTSPHIFWDYTTSKVLTMSYLPGIKIDNKVALEAAGFNLKKINQIGICCYLKQLLVDGFFQADPHPGNMAITADGRLAIYDFGMMAELKSLSKGRMVNIFWAVLRKDSAAVTDGLVDLGLVVALDDLRPVQRVVEFLLERFTDRPVDVREFNQIKAEIADMFEAQPFRLPPEMSFILKALSTLDGIARTLDPEYSLIRSAQPFITSIAVAESGSILSTNTIGKFGQQAGKYIKYKLTRTQAIELELRRIEQKLERNNLENSTRSLATDRSIAKLYFAIQNLIYLCYTGFCCLAGILLAASQPILATILFGMAGLGGLIWLRSLLSLVIQDRWEKFKRKK